MRYSSHVLTTQQLGLLKWIFFFVKLLVLSPFCFEQNVYVQWAVLNCLVTSFPVLRCRGRDDVRYCSTADKRLLKVLF